MPVSWKRPIVGRRRIVRAYMGEKEQERRAAEQKELAAQKHVRRAAQERRVEASGTAPSAPVAGAGADTVTLSKRKRADEMSRADDKAVVVVVE